MEAIGLKINACVVALGQAFLAGKLAFALGTNGARRACGTADATVAVIGLEVDTDALTIAQATLARQLALPFGADLT